MSRSNPQQNAPNPAQRFFEWNGEHGTIRYYDRELKENVIVTLPFTFLLLDELGSVRGWHDASASGIYSNEVRDTREDQFIVKAFKGGTLAEGLYKDIKDRVSRLGGQFVANCYIGFKLGDKLVIGSLRFKGAALGAWMEFRKQHRAELFEKAVVVNGYTEGKKGKVVYRMPTFAIKPLSSETNSEAIALDRTLQGWLEAYLSRTTHDRADEPAAGDDMALPSDDQADNTPIPDDLSDIPF
jgi:hypothetical protein